MEKHKRILPDTFGSYVLDNVLVSGKYDMPVIGYFNDYIPDYFCLYSNPSEYNKTDRTCVCFYEYDSLFDSLYGLWNSIKYKDERRLLKYKERFKNVNFIVSPDYSIPGDMPKAMQIFNIFRSRIVSIWIEKNCGCKIIPNLRFNNKNSYDFCFEGIAKRSIVALSIYGLCQKKENVQNLIDGLHETIIAINPPIILVYGKCKQEKYDLIFKECIENQIKIINIDSRLTKIRGKKYGITE